VRQAAQNLRQIVSIHLGGSTRASGKRRHSDCVSAVHSAPFPAASAPDYLLLL